MSSHRTILAALCAAAIGLASPAFAAKPGKKAGSKQAAPKPAAVEEAPAPEPPPPPKVDPTRPPQETLAEARSLFESLDYDRVIPLAAAVLAHPAATADERMDAYLLQGSCLSIVGDPIEAEKPFRFLLRGRPTFDVPKDTPPKIVAVFRKVQAEERAILEQTRELERKRLISEINLERPPLERGVGGYPLRFDYGLRDPRGVVETVRVQYRKKGDRDFSSLALAEDVGGRWRGEIPGEWTENENGFTLEYFVTTADADDAPLLVEHSATSPLTLAMEPGTVADATPYYQTVWFWTVTGVATSALLASGIVVGYFAVQPPESDLGTVSLDD